MSSEGIKSMSKTDQIEQTIRTRVFSDIHSKVFDPNHGLMEFQKEWDGLVVKLPFEINYICREICHEVCHHVTQKVKEAE